MKLGYNEATASGCSTLERDLALCERCGFDYIELRGDMLLDYLQRHRVEQLRQFFQNSHIRPHAVNALYTYNGMFHPQRADTARDRALMAYFLACCQVSQVIGNHHFIVVPHLLDDAGNIYLPHDPQDSDYPDSGEQVVADSVRILTTLSDIAKQYGINLCWEPVGSRGCAVRTVERAWEIVGAVDRDNVGLVMDSFNLYLNGGLSDYAVMKQVPLEKIFAVHINNCDGLPIGRVDHGDRRLVDSGVLNLDSYLSTLAEMGYNGMVSIETFREEYYRMKPEEIIPRAFETTKALVDRYRRGGMAQ